MVFKCSLHFNPTPRTYCVAGSLAVVQVNVQATHRPTQVVITSHLGRAEHLTQTLGILVDPALVRG